MTRPRSDVLVMAGLLVLGGVAPTQAQERAKPTGVKIQTQQLAQPDKSAVRVRPHAELSVDHVAHYPAPAKEGQSIAIEIKVENEGTAPSSGGETLHFDCRNKQSGGPACPFGAGQRSLPVIHSLKEPYPTGPYGHGVQLLTTPTWKPGSYEVTAWIVEPAKTTQPEIFTATIEVKPKLQIDPAATDQTKTAIFALSWPDLTVRIDPMEGGWHKITVKNQGGETSDPTKVGLTCGTFTGSQWQPNCYNWYGMMLKPLPSLAPGQETVVPQPYCLVPSTMSVDKCRITVIADPGGQVAEINEANNTGSYDIPR